MAIKRDYYEVLGIDRSATDEDIKRAFRKLAFQYHPDHNHEAEAEARFKEINEAYEVLSDAEKRANYDRFGQASAEGFFGRDFEGFGFGGFGSIFDAFFGGTATATQYAPQRGADLRCQITITFDEAAFGCQKEINLERTGHCSLCRGLGSKPGCQPSRCPNCNGTGQVRRVQQTIFGRFVNVATCSQCHGKGRVITEPCPQCRGVGREQQQRSLQVKIPAGVNSDTQLCLSGEGEAGLRGGTSGDLYVVVSVLPHKFFSRDGDDICYDLPVNFAQAALGIEVEVPTLDGKTKVEIPAGSQTGKIFRLKGKGIPHLHRGGRGDELVRLFVVTPEGLNEKQRQLLRELGKSFNETNMPSPEKWKGVSKGS